VTGLAWALDGALVLLLLGLAARVVLTRDLFEATVLFIGFGLTLSLVWVRLGAPDLALAEAALGTGVTGALILYAYRRLSEREESWGREGRAGARRTSRAQPAGTRWRRRILGVVVGTLAAGFAVLLLALPGRAPLLPSSVAERLAETGISNPVTGVVLNFRAYDTLLEVAVLVVALVAVWSMDRGSREFSRLEEDVGSDRVLGAFTRLVVPVVGLTAVYLVRVGSEAPGGAFQAGALLAGIGVLLAAGGILRPVTAEDPRVRALAVAGLAVVILAGLVSQAWTGSFLAYPDGMAPAFVLLMEAVLTVSIAVILTALFVDVTALPESEPSPERVDPTGDPLGRAVGIGGARVRAAEEGE